MRHLAREERDWVSTAHSTQRRRKRSTTAWNVRGNSLTVRIDQSMTCVVLPEPVSPQMTVAGCARMLCRIVSRAREIGSDARCRSIER